MEEEVRICMMPYFGNRSPIESADFSKLNQGLYATTFLAYGGKGQVCKECLVSDLIVQCQWYDSGKLSRPQSSRNSAPEDKTVNEEQEGLVLHGTTGTAPSRTAIITMSSRGVVVGRISGPCADLG